MSYGAYFAEVSQGPQKFVPADGFYSVLPFVTSALNATTLAPFTTSLLLSASENNNSYAFTTTSVGYPNVMPISFTFPLYADYINTFANYQCSSTMYPTQFPSSAPSREPSSVPTATPSLFPTQEPTLAPIVISTQTPTLQPSLIPTTVCLFLRSSPFFL